MSVHSFQQLQFFQTFWKKRPIVTQFDMWLLSNYNLWIIIRRRYIYREFSAGIYFILVNLYFFENYIDNNSRRSSNKIWLTKVGLRWPEPLRRLGNTSGEWQHDTGGTTNIFNDKKKYQHVSRIVEYWWLSGISQKMTPK